MEELKVFQKNKEYFRFLGINLNAATDKSRTSNRIILFGYLTFSLGVVVDFIYIIFYEANTFWEVIQSIYFCYLSIDMPITYALLVFRKQKLLEFTVNIENVVNASKLYFKIEIQLCKCEIDQKFKTFPFSHVMLSNVESTHRGNESSCGKDNQIHTPRSCMHNSHVWLSAVFHLRLSQLFYHRFGDGGFWTTMSDVVSWYSSYWNHVLASKIWMHSLSQFRI